MKAILFIFTTLFFSFQIFGQTAELRKSYKEATKSEASAKAFYEKVKNVSDSDSNAALLAYKGAGKTLLARYEPLLDRKDKVKAGINLVEKAIQNEPDNVEARLVRLSIQENLPKMFKYNGEIESDKKFIQSKLNSIKDEDLVKMINGYFAEFSK
ncbi:hypothetical protein [Moheibacter lacus]|uniref:Tetratricopeptide repeat-containing protein n=1 Tax=Moheibacter lacus TaxID=2745851 RepID=A0A838ZS16_9FLAO|nr:hypothetical protein [Moheibacter lacus]MBA5628789.1 hypothetical protein [Moheibacter lacus]